MGLNTDAEERQSPEVLLVIKLLDTFVDEGSCSACDQKDEEQKSKLMYDVLVHVAVIESFDADGANQNKRDIARILSRLSKRQCPVEAACSGYLHGCVVG